MSYQCADIFMARIPSLPIKVLKDFDQSNQNVDAFIKNYEEINLNKFFEESLLISSQSLYRSLKHPPIKSKKIKNFQLGLTKYLIRSSTRPTPFGVFKARVTNSAATVEVFALPKPPANILNFAWSRWYLN